MFWGMPYPIKGRFKDAGGPLSEAEDKEMRELTAEAMAGRLGERGQGRLLALLDRALAGKGGEDYRDKPDPDAAASLTAADKAACLKLGIDPESVEAAMHATDATDYQRRVAAMRGGAA